MSHWTILDSKYLLKRWWMNIREDRVQLHSGEVLREFHVLEYPDWACTMCITQNEEVVLVEQYRHGIERTSIELPSGMIEEGESAEAGARRELREETGYTSDEWHFLGKLAQEPARHTNYAHLFVCFEATRRHDQELDASENLAVTLVPIATVYDMVMRGEILHSTHVAALLLAHEWLNAGRRPRREKA